MMEHLRDIKKRAINALASEGWISIRESSSADEIIHHALRDAFNEGVESVETPKPRIIVERRRVDRRKGGSERTIDVVEGAESF